MKVNELVFETAKGDETEFSVLENPKTSMSSEDKEVIIMKKYHCGKDIVKPAEQIIRSILDMEPKKKLPNVILKREVVPEELKDAYSEAVDSYNKGMRMVLDAKSEMTDLLEKLIYHIIQSRFPTFKEHTRDMYQEGVIGILNSIDAYDPERGKPTTYFWRYILHEITEYINRTINKTTSHYASNIVRVKKAINKFDSEGRNYTIKDIAQETNISAETIAQTLKIMEYSKEKTYETTAALECEISQRIDSPETEYLKNEETQIIHKAVAALPEQQAKVIILRYGLASGEKMAFKIIADKLGIPIDQVKRMNNAGIRALRKNRSITGSFNLAREKKAINGTDLGIIPEKIGEQLMADLDLVMDED